MLFEFAYSKALFSVLLGFSDLLCSLAVEYGHVPSTMSLRHAICAVAAAYLPEDRFREQYEDHTRLALKHLISKIETPTSLVDADLFATCFLLWALNIDNKATTQRGLDVYKLTKISTLMFKQLTRAFSSRLGQARLQYSVPPLWIFAVNFSLFLTPFHAPRNLYINTPVNIKHRELYFAELSRISRNPHIYDSPLIEATWETIHPLVPLAFSCLREVFLGEITSDLERGKIVKLARRFIRSELEAPGFEAALLSLKELTASHSTAPTIACRVAFYVSLGKSFLELVETLLRLPVHDIVDGLIGPETSALGRKLIQSYLQGEVRCEGLLESYPQIAETHSLSLIIGGCTFSNQSFQESK
jgi:hypothetical protein